MLAYHFTAKKLRDGRPIPQIGEWLVHDGAIIPCESGLHASENPFDALTYAPGAILHRVELEGDIVPHGEPVDKHVGRRRRIIATIDATEIMRRFACWCVRQVWELVTDKRSRNAVEVAERHADGLATDAARDAAWAAAMDAARAAAWAAAGAAAGAAAWAAAWAASRDAAWDAASDAARAAAWAAAWDAAWAASRDASRDAAWDAARAAAWDAQRATFLEMVEQAFTEQLQKS